jgi:hypothetical protein
MARVSGRYVRIWSALMDGYVLAPGIGNERPLHGRGRVEDLPRVSVEARVLCAFVEEGIV